MSSLPLRYGVLLLLLLLLATPGTTTSAPPDAVGYRAGAASRTITPPDWMVRRYWMAGYSPDRYATAVHDPLVARALVIDDGRGPVVVVTMDLLGLTSNDAETVQAAIAARVPALAGRILLHATHNHEGPDTVGLWGGRGLLPFLNPRPQDYIDYIALRAAAAVEEAWTARRPVQVTAARIDNAVLADLFGDSRPPQVSDPAARLLIFADGDDVVATLVNWASHPEVLGPDNRAFTADYVPWVVAEIEEQLGGRALFVNGAIGGLLSSDRSEILPAYPRHSFEKAEAVGREVAIRLLQRLESPGSGDRVEQFATLPPITLQSRRYYVPVDNGLLVIGQRLGLVPKTLFFQFQIPPEEWWRPPTAPTTIYTDFEASFLTMGPISILTMGGELYPELLVGGIDPAVGIPPYNSAPAEVPLVANPRWTLYPYQFFFGLTNDFIGYVIPQSEWDGWLDGEYGEEFSTSPDEGSILSWNLHLLLLGYESGTYPPTDAHPSWLVEPSRSPEIQPLDPRLPASLHRLYRPAPYPRGR